ncbi:unnamed protein product [Adineta ricciae]|uniref:Uncharacterized protein n=1 Tax=Adineta ricciae TaxID=249248 RepID=A0A814Q4T9_ADIRI|nr:unnamed protein product [Adineta ricciae]CAF1114795.1 unnamed protein product [Adineta ricciae]
MAPVIVNPEIARESPSKTSTTPHHDHSSTRVPQYLPPFLSMHPVDDTQLLFRLYLDNTCDASNKTALSHKPVHLPSKSSNHSSFHQNLQNFLPTNESSPIHNANTVPLTMAQSEYHGLDPYLTRHIYPPLLYVNRNSPSVNRQYSRPMSLPSIPTPTVSKPKRTYSKKVCSVFSEQQPPEQSAPCPPAPSQPVYSNGLPSIIPSTVMVPSFQSDGHCPSKGVTGTEDFFPLTPSSSINSSTKSSPTIGNSDFSLLSIRQPSSSAQMDITESNLRLQQYFASQRCPSTPSPNINSFTGQKTSLVHELPSGIHTEHAKSQSTVLGSSNMFDPISSISTSVISKKGRKKRVKVAHTLNKQRENEKRKHRKSSMKEIRAKRELRRITNRNRLAILKFMMRKRKQGKQGRKPIPECLDTNMQSISTESSPVFTEKQSNLPEIIAPCLKISIDSSQNIESISLFYHRRRRPEIVKENTPTASTSIDNRLGLLLEAVEFIETLQENSKSATVSIK